MAAVQVAMREAKAEKAEAGVESTEEMAMVAREVAMGRTKEEVVKEEAMRPEGMAVGVVRKAATGMEEAMGRRRGEVAMEVANQAMGVVMGVLTEEAMGRREEELAMEMEVGMGPGKEEATGTAMEEALEEEVPERENEEGSMRMGVVGMEENVRVMGEMEVALAAKGLEANLVEEEEKELVK
mmetsp:Transcript_37717/g.66314  ORF Transcript_37717/g.66314 Transcript_37717/m.66314 type:complete len:183 (-) Transcript_37717:448-996(-)